MENISISKKQKDLLSLFSGKKLEKTVDYNLLMSIVEQIESTPYNLYIKVTIYNKSCRITKDSSNRLKDDIISEKSFAENKIEAILLTVCDFIEWYNKNIKYYKN